MYHAFVRRRIRMVFDGLSRGDYAIAVAGLAEDVHHVFAGDHAVGGERHSRDAVERWFERLFRLFEVRFDVRRVIVTGPPWNMAVVAEWRAHAVPRAGDPYQ
jgi:ketosteroid isomerase-like protein